MFWFTSLFRFSRDLDDVDVRLPLILDMFLQQVWLMRGFGIVEVSEPDFLFAPKCGLNLKQSFKYVILNRVQVLCDFSCIANLYTNTKIHQTSKRHCVVLKFFLVHSGDVSHLFADNDGGCVSLVRYHDCCSGSPVRFPLRVFPKCCQRT